MSSVQKLGKFEVTGQLGQGSFGIVYAGRDPHLDRDVAIKVCTLDDEELRKRFLREAAISGRLDHPNIVTVHEYSGEAETPYLVQEMLTGKDLRAVIKARQAWSVDRRLDALIQIAEGLAYAHGQGVIHRDIKPANIRVLDSGRVKILDFGIAKLANDESRLTQKGVTMGTASYLPPEQVRGGDIDHRSDLFSFGVLAYELLTFERPFRGKTISALVYQILYKVPAPLATVWPDCPGELSDLIASCLEKDASGRPDDAAQIATALATLRARLAAGEFPALVSAAPPPRPATVREEEGSATSDVLSQSMIARTAQAVTAERTAHRDSEATQPVPVIDDPQISPPAKVSGGAETQRLPTEQMETVRMDVGELPKPPHPRPFGDPGHGAPERAGRRDRPAAAPPSRWACGS
ncbi:MAG: serine/threonine-protein kinase [Acidobacteriota bacterium]